MKKIIDQIKTIKKLSKIHKKKACYLIGLTAQKSNKSYYLTPIRTSKKSVYSGAIVYNNHITKKICKIIDKKIDFIFVDVEKKIKYDKQNSLVNIERVVKDTIKTAQIKNYKSNDLTVRSFERLINEILIKDIRGVGGKKALVYGAGNIGFKIGLNLVESGCTTYFYRRNKKIQKNIVNTINLIKPSATLSSAKEVSKLDIKKNNFDLIISSADKINIFDMNMINKNYMPSVVIDAGKGNFTENARSYYIKNKVKLFRLDPERAQSAFIDSSLISHSKIKINVLSRIHIKNFSFIESGTLGMDNDIILDNIDNPKKIIGICGKDGQLKKIRKNYKKKILKIIKNKWKKKLPF